MVVDSTHQTETVDNHDDDYSHIFGKGEQQFPEVFALDRRVAAVECAYLVEAAHNLGNIVAPAFCKGVVIVVIARNRRQHDGQTHISVCPEAVAKAKCCIESRHQRVKAESVTRNGGTICMAAYGKFDAFDVGAVELAVEGTTIRRYVDSAIFNSLSVR